MRESNSSRLTRFLCVIALAFIVGEPLAQETPGGAPVESHPVFLQEMYEQFHLIVMPSGTWVENEHVFEIRFDAPDAESIPFQFIWQLCKSDEEALEMVEAKRKRDFFRSSVGKVAKIPAVGRSAHLRRGNPLHRNADHHRELIFARGSNAITL